VNAEDGDAVGLEKNRERLEDAVIPLLAAGGLEDLSAHRVRREARLVDPAFDDLADQHHLADAGLLDRLERLGPFGHLDVQDRPGERREFGRRVPLDAQDHELRARALELLRDTDRELALSRDQDHWLALLDGPAAAPDHASAALGAIPRLDPAIKSQMRRTSTDFTAIISRFLSASGLSTLEK
jgi:hypothetical protein